MVTVSLDDLRGTLGFGVAGNFAGHLEQAGEAGDFANVTAASAQAPKGIFPWYVPQDPGFLGTFPLSHDTLVLPPTAEDGGPVNLQIEPEAGVLFAVSYAGDGTVTALEPTLLGAFDDCSIRRPGAPKISHKKNWGPASKGVARACFAVTDLDPGAATATLRLASFLRRDGQAHPYGTDSALADYSYYGTQLLDWLVERLAGQQGTDGTPLEDVGALLIAAGRPASVLVGIGATRYTPFGETTFLQLGDEAIVVAYDADVTSPDALAAAVATGREDDVAAASVLRQRVVAASVA